MAFLRQMSWVFIPPFSRVWNQLLCTVCNHHIKFLQLKGRFVFLLSALETSPGWRRSLKHSQCACYRKLWGGEEFRGELGPQAFGGGTTVSGQQPASTVVVRPAPHSSVPGSEGKSFSSCSAKLVLELHWLPHLCWNLG